MKKDCLCFILEYISFCFIQFNQILLWKFILIYKIAFLYDLVTFVCYTVEKKNKKYKLITLKKYDCINFIKFVEKFNFKIHFLLFVGSEASIYV